MELRINRVRINRARPVTGIQRKCLRQIDNSTTVAEVYRKLNILTVGQLIELEQSRMGYKLCNGLLPTAITRILMSDQDSRPMNKTHEYETRQKNVPNRPKVKSRLYMDSFLYKSYPAIVICPRELETHPLYQHLPD